MNQSTLKDSSERGDKRHEWANLKTEIEASIDAICRGNFDEMCRQFFKLGHITHQLENATLEK